MFNSANRHLSAVDMLFEQNGFYGLGVVLFYHGLHNSLQQKQ